MNVFDAIRKPLGYIQTADLSTAQSLTVPNNAKIAIVQAIDNDISWRDDGTAAANTAGGIAGGMLLAAGDSFLYIGDLQKLSLIEAVNGSTAYANVTFYK